MVDFVHNKTKVFLIVQLSTIEERRGNHSLLLLHLHSCSLFLSFESKWSDDDCVVMIWFIIQSSFSLSFHSSCSLLQFKRMQRKGGRRRRKERKTFTLVLHSNVYDTIESIFPSSFLLSSFYSLPPPFFLFFFCSSFEFFQCIHVSKKVSHDIEYVSICVYSPPLFHFADFSSLFSESFFASIFSTLILPD